MEILDKKAIDLYLMSEYDTNFIALVEYAIKDKNRKYYISALYDDRTDTCIRMQSTIESLYDIMKVMKEFVVNNIDPLELLIEFDDAVMKHTIKGDITKLYPSLVDLTIDTFRSIDEFSSDSKLMIINNN